MKRDVFTVIEVLSGAAQGLSLGQIQARTGVPKTTVKRICDRATEAGIDPARFQELSTEQVKEIFLRKRRSAMHYAEPDWEAVYIKHERPRHNITLRVAWEEYCAGVGDAQRAMSYATFCRAYEQYKGDLPAKFDEVRMSFEWQPGEVAMMDYSGDRLYYVDSNGKKCKAEIFVGVLAHSGLIFCMATPDQTRLSWLSGCQKMLEYFGAVPQYIFFDNSTSLVVKADKYEPKYCDDLLGFAEYYGFVPYACRPGAPRDKAMVENAVGIVQRRITNRLVTAQFLSLEDVNYELAQLLEDLNDRPMVEKMVSRRQLHSEELPVMKPLPSIPYEPGMVEKLLKVRKDYQVRLNNRRFSVPYLYAGKTVKVRLWGQKNLVVVYDIQTGKQIAQHHYEEVGKKQNILLEHMPVNHVAVMRSKEALLEELKTLSPHLAVLGSKLTGNQPLRVARRILSGMLASLRRLGRDKANEVAIKVLNRPNPKLEDFRQEVDMITGVVRSDVKINPHVRMQIEVGRKNVRGADYYAQRLEDERRKQKVCSGVSEETIKENSNE